MRAAHHAWHLSEQPARREGEAVSSRRRHVRGAQVLVARVRVPHGVSGVSCVRSLVLLVRHGGF